MSAQNTNVDPSELEKFSTLAHRWWDPGSEFKPLHVINPVRLRWIDSVAALRGKRVLDVGCGGGILAESMAQQGAEVTGIDMAEKALGVARLHSLESGVKVDYRLTSAEALAAETPETFDVVTCMEMLEHVPDPASVVAAVSRLAKPGADVFFSTINRNLKAYLLAIVGAEYVLRLLPRGTHDYAKLITPSELARAARDAQLEIIDIKGMSYNPITHTATLNKDTDVNYLVHARKRVAA
ncbi:MAG TPA: bifunctional 2-polyprenyl-6-hydroxyphenol methylase/3-demethylubiquinol 3-O-methyltransferase UbiG [Burkholderiaceae bacterium]|nr:bifunctional 2-polyprenyl-6-hydroxyphenol methylase/3-demethylubiquinol 3-O-methyltransferase UbiG [Burkholderiaceae bacterium]